MITLLDKYIMKKFIGTFFFSIVLIISISIIFDLTEKLDNFIENKAPLSAIIFDYYMNFIPYYANMFTPLFTFISVIFFTSKLAGNSEIIAMLASGVNFSRLLRPYFYSAAIIAAISFILSGYVIPPANKVRLNFENRYVSKFTSEVARNLQFELSPGTIIFIDRYEEKNDRGYRFSMETFDGKHLLSRLTASKITRIEDNKFRIEDYLERRFDGLYERIDKGESRDTTIFMDPKEFFITTKNAQEMNNYQLREHIKKQDSRGAGNVQAFKDDYYKRFAFPMGAFILTLIGVMLSSRKVKGGMGLNLGIGIGLSALYILFSTISSSFAVNGTMPVLLAVWLPNLIFLLIGGVLYFTMPR